MWLVVIFALMGGSLPMRGAWIEISKCREVRKKTYRRSPCGERGLKYDAEHVIGRSDVSLPMRGAWIEILETNPCSSAEFVAPHARSVD